MQVRELINDEEAVSPVIGVILMVAITVILAAVIGTFVLGLGDQVSNTSPSASFTFDFETNTGGEVVDSFGNKGKNVNQDGLLTITHDGGDKIEAQLLSISGASSLSGSSKITNNPASNPSNPTAASYVEGDSVTAGNQIRVWASNDDTVRVTWEASGGGDTATLGKWTGPNA